MAVVAESAQDGLGGMLEHEVQVRIAQGDAELRSPFAVEPPAVSRTHDDLAGEPLAVGCDGSEVWTCLTHGGCSSQFAQSVPELVESLLQDRRDLGVVTEQPRRVVAGNERGAFHSP